MMYEPKEFIRTLQNRASQYGFSDSEVLYCEGISTEIQVRKGEVIQYESSDTHGISFRGTFEGQMGYAYTEIPDEASIDYLLQATSTNASVLETEDFETIYEGDPEYREILSYSESIAHLSFDTLSSLALDLEKKILSFDSRIVAVDHCGISYSEDCGIISNTLGLSLEDRQNILVIYASIRCEEEQMIKTASGFRFVRDLKNLNIDDLAREISQKALSKLHAKTIASDNYTVIFHPEAVCDLLSSFSGSFSAEAVQKGFSLLAGKVGEKIASDLISLRDDVTVEGSLTGTGFDSEGVATQDLLLLDHGVLKGFLHNRKTAAKEGLKSTGNGFRGYKSSLSIGSKNLYIAPGVTRKEDLFAAVKDGILITDLSGLHAGTNGISGDFSLSAEGFLIRDGKICEPVEQITVADNFFQLLKKVSHVGDSLQFHPPSDTGSIGAPYLVVPNVSLSGE